MGLETRKAFVEFTSRNQCIITTSFKQKSFELKSGDYIDLIALKKVNGTINLYKSAQIPFFAHCQEYDSGTHPYIRMRVYAVIDASERPELWGTADIYKNREACFQGTVWNKHD